MKKFIIALLLGFLMIINVDAASLELKGETSKITVRDDEPTVINLNIKDIAQGETIKQIKFDFTYDKEKISLDIPKSQYGYPVSESGDTIYITKIVGSNGKDFAEGTVMSFNLKDLAEEDETVEFKLSNVKVTDDSNVETDLEEVVIQVSLKKSVRTTTRAKYTSAAITGFKVNNNATVKPAFSSKTFEYKIYVKDTIRDITISPSYEQGGVNLESECTLGCNVDTTMPNKFKLVTGRNEATLTLTSEDGKDEKTYKFIIYRGPTTDGSNLLAGLTLETYALKETFDKNTLDYTVTVPYETEAVKVNATPEDENADVKIKGNEGLKVGENVITVTVTSAETTEKKIYNITVTREEFKPEEEPTTSTVTPVVEEPDDTTTTGNKGNIKLIIIIGVVSLLIIGLAAYFIFFYKGKDKKKKPKKEELPKLSKPKTKLQSEIIDEDKEPTSVDEALEDLMKTKEITKSDEEL